MIHLHIKEFADAATSSDAIDYLDLISKCAILISLIGLLVNMRQTRRLNYIACTAKYTKIQEILLGNEQFAALHMRIYKDKLADAQITDADLPQDKRSKAQKLSEELALSAMMFQLMEDVWTVDLQRKNSWIISPKKRKDLADTYAGWDALFRDWMSTPEIREKWPVLKSHYNKSFVADTEHHY